MSSKKINNIRLENFANQLRLDMGIKSIDPVSIHQLLRKKNIIASFQPLSEDFEGIAVRIAENNESQKLFMLINTNSCYGRQRFTACHELYHLLFQDNFSVSYDAKSTGEKDEEEKNADYFACCLLLPEEGLRMLTPPEETLKDHITIATILKLEQNFRCSRTCLLSRLKALGWITEQTYDKYKSGVIRSASEYGYDISLYLPTKNKELIGDYNLKARELYDKGLISQSRYFGLLRDMGVDFIKEK